VASIWLAAARDGFFYSEDMTKGEFEVGAHWALRPSQTLGAPAQRVELLFLTKGGRGARCKVRHAEGELEGLEEFVHLPHLRCPWKDWPKVDRDERKELELIEATEQAEELDPAVVEAAKEVLHATGEDLWIEEHRGYTRWNEDAALERVGARAGIDGAPWRRHPAFKSHRGVNFIPNKVLVDLAIAFAQAEPQTVHLHLDTQEQKLLREGFVSGATSAHEELLKSKPAFAIARQWAGGAQENRYLREELQRTQELLRRAIYGLKDCGAIQRARYIERELEGK